MGCGNVGNPKERAGRRRSLYGGGRALAVGLIVCMFSLNGALASSDHPKSPTTTIEEGPEHVELGEPSCKVEEVRGLEFCPQLEPMMPILLENKRHLLELALGAANDAGGTSPLMVIAGVTIEVSDFFFSKFTYEETKIEGWFQEQRRLNESWVQEQERMNITVTEGRPAERFLDRVDTFYAENINRSRPVVIFVHHDQACALFDELKLEEGLEEDEAAVSTNGVPMLTSAGLRRSADSKIAEGRTPLALVTLGWDGNGSPFVHEPECSLKVLGLPQVVRWFVSHHQGDSPDPKVVFLALGFGWAAPRSGLQDSQLITASADKLQGMENCRANDTMEVLFQCNNNASNTNRNAINNILQDADFGLDDSVSVVPKVIPDNRFPLESMATVTASADGLFAISPPGTRPDCFRHYEFLLAGNIVYIPDDPSLRVVLTGLPVVFVQGGAEGWGKINCDTLAHHAELVARRLKRGLGPGKKPAFNYSKLMLPYWIQFVRDNVWQAGVEIRRRGEGLTAGSDDVHEPSGYYPAMVVGGYHGDH